MFGGRGGLFGDMDQMMNMGGMNGGGGMSFSGRSVQPEDIMSSQTFIGPPIWMAAAGGSGGGFGGGGNSRGDDTARTHVPVPPPPRTDGIVARPTGSRRVRQSTQTTAQT